MIPGLGIEELIALDKEGRATYFDQYARYVADSPPGRGYQYAVRVGSKTLFSDDTHDLRNMMVRTIAAFKRRREYRKSPTTIRSR